MFIRVGVFIPPVQRLVTDGITEDTLATEDLENTHACLACAEIKRCHGGGGTNTRDKETTSPLSSGPRD
jgi:hypothetical protein